MIYLDHAATTQSAPEVVEAMLPYLKGNYGNPSSLHQLGRQAKKALNEARQTVADFLNCQPQEIIFTSGGTESCNLALKGLAQKKHIITTNIEHSAVLEACRHLETQGYQVTYLPVNEDGLIEPKQVLQAITKDTGLIAIMHANNEIGTIQPIKEIASQTDVPVFTDACQSAPYLSLDVQQLGVSSLALNGSKIYGPKGVGVLYLQQDTHLKPQVHGGDQEFGLRAGTENLTPIVGLAKAIEMITQNREQEAKRQSELRDYLIQELQKNFPGLKLNGHPSKRLPNNINVSFENVEGESLLLRLNDNNIFVSTGSACSSQKLEPSHVLEAIGLSKNDIHSSLRITLGKDSTQEQIDSFMQTLKKIVKDLNEVSSFL